MKHHNDNEQHVRRVTDALPYTHYAWERVYARIGENSRTQCSAFNWTRLTRVWARGFRVRSLTRFRRSLKKRPETKNTRRYWSSYENESQTKLLKEATTCQRHFRGVNHETRTKSTIAHKTSTVCGALSFPLSTGRHYFFNNLPIHGVSGTIMN